MNAPRLGRLIGLVRADVESNRSSVGLGGGRGQRLQFLLSVRGLSTVLVRLAHTAWTAGGPGRVVALGLKQCNHVITGADIAPDAVIGAGLRLFHTSGVVIGPGVHLGDDCTIQSDVVVGGTGGPVRGGNGAPTIGRGVHLGSGAKVIGEVSIADEVSVGANAVVTHSIDVPRAVVVGVPARIVGS
jgi:serine O-acetyltransferase